MVKSVADRVKSRMPRPVRCDSCGGPKVHLQKRAFMGMRTHSKWDLVWHCGDCGALVGTHAGTDIPLGLMASAQVRDGRFRVHQVFDKLWKGGGFSRETAYTWLAVTLNLAPEKAHISMLNLEQCEKVIEEVEKLRHRRRHSNHWSQDKRKKRRR